MEKIQPASVGKHMNKTPDYVIFSDITEAQLRYKIELTNNERKTLNLPNFHHKQSKVLSLSWKSLYQFETVRQSVMKSAAGSAGDTFSNKNWARDKNFLRTEPREHLHSHLWMQMWTLISQLYGILGPCPKPKAWLGILIKSILI